MIANKCHYSAVDVPCVVRTPTREDCRACLMAAIEMEEGICEICGADRKVYLETMHRPCRKDHGIGSGRGKLQDDPLRLAALIPDGEGVRQ